MVEGVEEGSASKGNRGRREEDGRRRRAKYVVKSIPYIDQFRQ
jgi:hypothetical protein